MVKFLVFAAVGAISALLTGSTTQAVAPCVQTNFLEKSADFASINQLIDLAKMSGLLTSGLAAVDPLTVQDKRLDAVPFSVLGVDFTLTPIIQTLNVKGISTVVPRHVNVTAPTNLDIGADFSGEVALTGTVRFEVAQLKHQWWQICWTNILKPKNCPPAIMDVDVAVGLHKPTLFTNALVAMSSCSPTAQAGTCSDLTINDIISSALAGQFTQLLARIQRRLKEVAIADLKLGFDQITQLNFHFRSSGPLITELGKKLLAFSTKEINKKGDLYNGVIAVSNKLGKTLINQVIKDKLAPSFGNTCYDA